MTDSLESFSGSVELVIDKNGQVRQAGASRAADFIADLKRRAENSLYVFAKIVMGYDLLSPTLHLPECNRLQSSTPSPRKLTLLPRGHLKTTILKALVCHNIIQSGEPLEDGTFNNVYFPRGIIGTRRPTGTDIRILLASKTAALSQSTLAEIVMTIEGNELLRGLWPHCFWENTKDARWWNQEKIVVPRQANHKEATVETIGVGGQITGYHFNVQIFDDLIDITTANSATEMEKTKEWWRASRALMHDQKRSREYIVGTRWAVSDLYDWIIKNDNVDLGGSVHVHARAMVEDGAVIFPEMFDMDDVARMQVEHGALFPLLYMNSASDRSLTDFDMTQVRRFKRIDNKLYFEENLSDRALAERRREATDLRTGLAERTAEGVRRRQQLLNQEGYDTLVARNEHLNYQRFRGE